MSTRRWNTLAGPKSKPGTPGASPSGNLKRVPTRYVIKATLECANVTVSLPGVVGVGFGLALGELNEENSKPTQVKEGTGYIHWPERSSFTVPLPGVGGRFRPCMGSWRVWLEWYRFRPPWWRPV
jgi:hypothetical protein